MKDKQRLPINPSASFVEFLAGFRSSSFPRNYTRSNVIDLEPSEYRVVVDMYALPPPDTQVEE